MFSFGGLCFSILYCADGVIFRAGPFKTEAEADQYVREHSYPREDYEFDLGVHHVYLLRPDHSLVEYPSDFADPE